MHSDLVTHSVHQPPKDDWPHPYQSPLSSAIETFVNPMADATAEMHFTVKAVSSSNFNSIDWWSWSELRQYNRALLEVISIANLWVYLGFDHCCFSWVTLLVVPENHGLSSPVRDSWESTEAVRWDRRQAEGEEGNIGGWATVEIVAQRRQRLQHRGGRIASHPADDRNARAGGKATFLQHHVRIRGLLVGCGQRKQTTMTTSHGPPDDDDEGCNVSTLWAYAAVFFSN